MAKFLNRELLNKWLDKIIIEAKNELLIIVPYIQTSDRIYSQLIDANNRGVDITMVYKENKLNSHERKKLDSISNLNLMHHPNLHAKCYYNEEYLIIGSMNLYAYSERNNREMGILLHRESLEEDKDNWSDGDDEQIFIDAVVEIRNILNSSVIEKRSIKTQKEGFEIDIIKTPKEKAEEYCKVLNQYFVPKKFEAIETEVGFKTCCINYYDKIDVCFEYRIAIHFKHQKNHLKNIHSKFSRSYNEFMFDGFKFYWNEYDPTIAYFYEDSKHPFWKKQLSKAEQYKFIENGINDFIEKIKADLIIR
ncbi:MAG: phospholipase D family protein [Chitinophagales bacterium]